MTTLKKVYIVAYIPSGCPAYDVSIEKVYTSRKDAEKWIKDNSDPYDEDRDVDEYGETDYYIIEQPVCYPKQKKSATR